ncbi:MAG: VTT domain-containing protein [Candidatus Bathyarchaeia archaeon]
MSFQTVFQQFGQWMENFSVQYGYFGVFLMSLLGSMSIIFPIPYTVILFTLGSLEMFNPILLAMACGVGSAIGEFSGYLLGLGGRKIISERSKRKMEFFLKIFEKFGPVAVFIFALTPLPDDLLFIPLGIMRYSFLKAFIPAILGKICMSLIIVYSARFTIQIIQQIFGVESDWMSAGISMVIAIILLIIILVLMFKIDWERVFQKHVDKINGNAA